MYEWSSGGIDEKDAMCRGCVLEICNKEDVRGGFKSEGRGVNKRPRQTGRRGVGSSTQKKIPLCKDPRRNGDISRHPSRALTSSSFKHLALYPWAHQYSASS